MRSGRTVDPRSETARHVGDGSRRSTAHVNLDPELPFVTSRIAMVDGDASF